jgi:hypothetical protein
MVIVDLLMYCFQASLPDSRPPPVCFSPPKAPPISAPEVGMFTLTIPQSDPFGPIHYKKKQKISNRQRRSNHLEYVLDALGENTGRKTLRYFVVPRNSFFDAFSFQNVDDGGETLVVN